MVEVSKFVDSEILVEIEADAIVDHFSNFPGYTHMNKSPCTQ
jgi:hypothetical protein